MDISNSESSDLRNLILKIPSFENISRIFDILRGYLEEYADDDNLDKASNIEILEKSVHYWKWIYPLIQSGEINQYQTIFDKVDPGLFEELNFLLVLFDDEFTTPFVLREVNTDIVPLIDEFISFLESEKEHLISTGYQQYNFHLSSWFSNNLSDLLITKIPEYSDIIPKYDDMDMDEGSQAPQSHEHIYDWG